MLIVVWRHSQKSYLVTHGSKVLQIPLSVNQIRSHGWEIGIPNSRSSMTWDINIRTVRSRNSHQSHL